MINKLPKKLIWVLAVLLFGVIFFSFIYKGSVKIEVGSASAIKEGAEVTFSADNHSKQYDIPSTVRLRPGKYTLIAGAPGSVPYQSEITVTAFETVVVSVLLSENQDANLPGSNPTGDAIEKVPHLEKFPEITGDYRIDAITDSEFKQIVKIRITIIHRFFSPDETELYAQERQVALEGANKWLDQNDIPKSIKREVVDK